MQRNATDLDAMKSPVLTRGDGSAKHGDCVRLDASKIAIH